MSGDVAGLHRWGSKPHVPESTWCVRVVHGRKRDRALAGPIGVTPPSLVPPRGLTLDGQAAPSALLSSLAAGRFLKRADRVWRMPVRPCWDPYSPNAL